MSRHQEEVTSGQRFEFGSNWTRFLQVLDDNRIQIAEDSLKRMLGVETLSAQRFVDVGSGSGLFSLAARRLGAIVHSFDYDPQSVACTAELKRRYFPGDDEWVVEEGSVLDNEYLNGLGQFDVVYSWGVLHHTGAMWNALENIIRLVAPGGRLFISIYNDQGGWSRRWRVLKRIYNIIPRPLRFLYVCVTMLPRAGYSMLGSLVRGKLSKYLDTVLNYSKRSLRGMSYWHDMVDWIGGYPFEVAKPEAIFDYYHVRGFVLEHLKTCGGGIGCNEFVFTRMDKSNSVE